MTVKRPLVKRSPSKLPIHPSPLLPDLTKPNTKDIEIALQDHWIDGFLVVTQNGKQVYINNLGQQMCDLIAQE
ncbi:MAG: hypothetical protein F6K11_36785, partial [Leptolyngbya sp. SIO3F4]|nr:hypothetical protein [Leptolyngbya sp. SIO3F4]